MKNVLALTRFNTYLFLVAAGVNLCWNGLPCGHAQDLPDHLPEIRYHLTARPWQPSGVQPNDILQTIEGICRVAKQFQDEQGAIIDPYLKREHQYSTPYYAHAVGTLIHAGRAMDLLDSGIAAMEHSTECLAGGSESIPDQHGEFFIAPLTEALGLYRDHVNSPTHSRWYERMKTPVSEIMRDMHGRLNNWRTYAMKGEWIRAQHGLVNRDDAVAFIEHAWNSLTQKERIGLDKWNNYQDWSSDPQSHAVEAVGRGNLIAMLAAGYDGPSANEMWDSVRRGTQTTLLLQSPDGQCPPNGRTDNHIFNDVLYHLIFEAMAQDALKRDANHLASQYRHAAMTAFQSIHRWKRTEYPWVGSFFITKNHFDPELRVGHQPASQWGNYNGAVMLHLAEAYHARQRNITEAPSPTEIGGYAIRTDRRFGSFAANAGGMQVFANLRGASVTKYNMSWTPLGVVRFSRIDWDSRLGPSDGEHDPEAGELLSFSRGSGESGHTFRHFSGITFAPTWIENGNWIRMADVHEHYRGEATVEMAHPLLTKFHINYHYVTGRGGPYIRHEFVITPDGVLTNMIPLQPGEYGVTVPLLENDGRPLQISVHHGIASTKYEEAGDEQNFIVLNEEAMLEVEGESLRGTYGWLKPVRVRSKDEPTSIFVYPRNEGDPSALELKNNIRVEGSTISAPFFAVRDTVYVGRTSAGGVAGAIDLDGDGDEEVTFDQTCGFILQLENGNVTAAEADRQVQMQYRNTQITLQPYTPVDLEQ